MQEIDREILESYLSITDRINEEIKKIDKIIRKPNKMMMQSF